VVRLIESWCCVDGASGRNDLEVVRLLEGWCCVDGASGRNDLEVVRLRAGVVLMVRVAGMIWRWCD